MIDDELLFLLGWFGCCCWSGTPADDRSRKSEAHRAKQPASDVTHLLDHHRDIVAARAVMTPFSESVGAEQGRGWWWG